MKLRIAMDDKEMDLRLRDRFLTEGKISKTDVDTYLSALPDDEGKYEKVEDTPVEEETTTTEL